MSILRLTSEGGRPTANEHSPRPRDPIWAWPSSLVVAPHSGGCGCCSGLGWTRRRGICQYFPENSVYSLVQQPTTWPIASCHIGAALGRVDAESLELGPGGRAPGAHVHPAAREQVEHRHRLGRAHRMVVRLGHEPHAVAQANPLRARRRWRRRAPRDWSSGSTPPRSGARPSRRRPTRSGRPAIACSSVFWYATSSLSGSHGRGTGIS